MKFGKKIKELRLKKGISQQDMADDFFVDAKLIDKWEKNKVLPDGKTIIRLEEYFGVEENYFITPDEYKALVKKREKKTLITFISSACVVGLLVIFGILVWIYGANLADDGTVITRNDYEYVVYKDTPFFGDGECALLSLDGDTQVVLPDTITRRTGPFNKTYKVKYIVASMVEADGVSITLPRYFERFVSAYPTGDDLMAVSSTIYLDYQKISVSPKNKKYDSRDDCGCLINSETDTLVLSSKESFIPNGVKVLPSRSMTYYFASNDELILPESVDAIEEYAFSYGYSAEEPHEVTYIDLGSIKEIGEAAFMSAYFGGNTKIILPSTLETIDVDAFLNRAHSSEYSSIFYEGSKSDWDLVQKYKENYLGLQYYDDIYLGEANVYSFTRYNFYYYSETEPTEKNVYWHYDINNNPVIWS